MNYYDVKEVLLQQMNVSLLFDDITNLKAQ